MSKEVSQTEIHKLSGGSLAKHTKFITGMCNFDPRYSLLGFSLKEVAREVYKHLVSEMFILTLFAVNEKLKSMQMLSM